MLALAFPRVFIDSCVYTCVSQCMYELLSLRFSVFVWTLVLALAFLSVFMNSACACVAGCL